MKKKTARLGIDDIMRHCGSTKYTESPNVQYILANNKQYKHFDVRKPVDWSVSTTEQSQNLQFVLLKFFFNNCFSKVNNLSQQIE